MAEKSAQYNPLTGEKWDEAVARELWGQSMFRSRYIEGPAWQYRGQYRGGGCWSYFNFKSFLGWVDVLADGFHWQTMSYDTGEQLHSGVTTSIYEAYQSVVQNKPVKRPAG